MGNLIHKIKKAFQQPELIPLRFIPNRLLPDLIFLKGQYRLETGQKLNIKKPLLFNEKIQWLKLYDRQPEYTMMADKYEVRKYIAQTIGEEYLIPLLGAWDSFDDISFDALPDQFVLKCTHDSGGFVICQDKRLLDIPKTREFFKKRLSENYYRRNREWVYKNVRPRIIAVKFMVDESGVGLKDYRIFCFNGEPKIIEVDIDQFIDHKRNFYSPRWEYQPLINDKPNAPQNMVQKPGSLELMLNLAKKLSASKKHLRVDLYSVNNKIYFGELTFYDGAGYNSYEPPEWNRIFGDWMTLPEKNDERKSSFNIMHKIKKAIQQPELIPLRFIPNRLLSDRFFLKCHYRLRTGQKLNLKNPLLFNEKIQWLKLYDRQPEYTMMSDKYEVRKYIAQTIGEEYLIPLYGVWDSFDEIPFDSLPDQFVLKCTHDSGSIVICKNKHSFKIPKTREYFKKRLSENYYWHNREWAYKNVRPRIVAEKLMIDESGVGLKDYKIFCFSGEPRIIEVDIDRFTDHKRNFYSPGWEYQPLINDRPNAPQNMAQKPDSLELMLRLARKLSAGKIHLRVDFYSVNNKVYFGELTFYDGGGYNSYEPPEWNRIFGDWMTLPENS